MKKTLIALVLVSALLIVLSTTVLANGGPHGGYTTTTDACAGCHRAHTASNARLLMQSSTALCQSCHGTAGSGANTNVDDGFYLSTRDDSASNENVGAANTPDNSPLLGGGFVNYGGVAITSNHTFGEANTWGQGLTDRGASSALAGGKTLQCVSCHDPHGNTNYRIIKTTINGVGSITVAQVDEGASKDYDTEQWGAGQSTLCAACHDAYHQTAVGQGSTLSGSSYTHRVDMQWDADFAGAVNPELTGLDGYTLPLAETVVPTEDGVVVCQTCHMPHGTSAAMSGLASGTYDPSGALGPIPSGDSALLRLDNRAVCEVCHQK